jgi:hypothetical protein
MDSPITIRLGARARRRIAAEGLQAADIAIIPAAAGGPKGLILHGIDTWLFGDWLPRAPRERQLIGASIGAWRMAAGAFADPVAAHKRLAHHYTHQTYPARVDAAYVSRTVRGLLEEVLAGHGGEVLAHPHHRVAVITARGIGPLANAGGVRWREMAGFLRAAAGNAVPAAGWRAAWSACCSTTRAAKAPGCANASMRSRRTSSACAPATCTTRCWPPARFPSCSRQCATLPVRHLVPTGTVA